MSNRVTGAPSVPGCQVSFTWKAPAAACRFVGGLGGAVVGLGAAADGLEGDADEPPLAAITAPVPPISRIIAPTTIRMIGRRRRDDGGPGVVAGDGTTPGDAGRSCGSLGGGGNSSIGSLSPFGPRGSTTRKPVARRGAVASAVWRPTGSRS